MTNEATLRLSTFDDAEPEDGIWHILLAATNGSFTATEQLYTNAEYFRDFAGALAAFPKSRTDQAIFEIGSLEGNAACYIRLRAYLCDGVGHVALEVQIDNRRTDHHQAKATFNIPCEVAAINRMGDALARWISAPSQPMIWQPEQRPF